MAQKRSSISATQERTGRRDGKPLTDFEIAGADGFLFRRRRLSAATRLRFPAGR